MTIILMRHGKPDRLPSRRIAAHAMEEWIEQYDEARISDAPPERCRTIARQARVIVSSPLPRARASLEKLGLQPTLTDALFREVALPVFPVPALQLSPGLWAPLLRLLWLCGYSGSVESFRHASQRAAEAAIRLINLSEQGTVLLAGHGIMNKLIARALRQRGWQAEKHASSRHWSTAIYNPPLI